MDAAERGRLMFKLADLAEKHAEELAALESLNCGKTINDSKGDLQGVINTPRYYAGWADKIEGKTVPVRGNFLSYTLRQPVGVVGQIIPWNFPLLMLAWKWGPALACGNAIVMKLAEQTPLTGMRLAELATEAGADALVAWQAARCVARWDGARADKGLRRWRAVARAAAQQSRRGYIPSVDGVLSTATLAQLVGDVGLVKGQAGGKGRDGDEGGYGQATDDCQRRVAPAPAP